MEWGFLHFLRQRFSINNTCLTLRYVYVEMINTSCQCKYSATRSTHNLIHPKLSITHKRWPKYPHNIKGWLHTYTMCQCIDGKLVNKNNQDNSCVNVMRATTQLTKRGDGTQLQRRADTRNSIKWSWFFKFGVLLIVLDGHLVYWLLYCVCRIWSTHGENICMACKPYYIFVPCGMNPINTYSCTYVYAREFKCF